MRPPDTRYTKSGDVHIAYQVHGDGQLDLVFIAGGWSHLDLLWEWPGFERLLNRLGSFSRVVGFDRRGTGLSDRSVGPPLLEQQVDDVIAVMDAVGIERAAILGVADGGALGAYLAAAHPERVVALVAYAATLKGSPPWINVDWDALLAMADREWGDPSMLHLFAPSQAENPALQEWWVRFQRASTSPGGVRGLVEVWRNIDVEHILDTAHVPTLVLHRTGDRLFPIEGGRIIASRIPGAKFVELPGDDMLPFVGDIDALVDEVQEFLTGIRPVPEPDRVLATLMFTDIAGSTERAAEMGDRRWKELLSAHDAAIRRQLDRFRGREVKTTGDGFLATFDGPARAVRCAAAIREAATGLGIEVRSGVHTGEIEVIGEDVAGIGVHIAARIAALSGPREIVASSTVKDLVAGSGIAFEDRGEHDLKGVPGEWRLYAVTST